MLWGMSGKPCPPGLTGAGVFNSTRVPLLTAAIAQRETLSVMPWAQALTYIAFDNGHGLMQLTSSWPPVGWDDALTNVAYAWSNFITPALNYWHGLEQYTGDTLVLLVAATYNEGLSAARKYHASGDVDAETTDEYGHGVLAYYTSLENTGTFG
jgi:hypothetical protein